MATTARGDDPNLRDAVMRMARQVAQMRANPTSRKAKPLVAISPGQSNVPMAKKVK
jgi:hypothetical protein